MALCASSSATINFGLVSIPVNLYPAYESGLQFRCSLIAGDDESTAAQAADFTEKQLNKSDNIPSQSIDIIEFVRAGPIDCRHLDRVFFLGACQGGARAYKVLADGLRKTDRTAVVKYVSPGRECLAMLRAEGHGLAMTQFRDAGALRPDLAVPMQSVERETE